MIASVPVRWRLAIRDSQLGRTPKLVAVMLSTWMNADGVCWPSRSTIARACSLTERGVDKALAELGDFLAIDRTAGGNPATSVNRYRAVLPVNGVHGSGGGGANGVPTPANGETETPEPRSPEVEVEVEREDVGAFQPGERDYVATVARAIRQSLNGGPPVDLAAIEEPA